MTSTTISTAAATTIPTQHGIDGTTTTVAATSSEYMVKQSQEGLKLTINKTSNKSSSSSFFSNKAKSASTSNLTLFNNSQQQQTFSASTKKTPQHTGLKPGVNSGPASKKSPAHTSASGGSSGGNGGTGITITTSKNFPTKHIFQKSNSSGNLNFKLSSSPSKNHTMSGGNMTKKTERERDRSSSSSSSQPSSRLDHHADMMKILQYASPTMAANMEGFMKNLNNKFQIPKLSQRSSASTTGIKSTVSTTAGI